MPARWQNAPSLQAQVDELYRRARAQSAQGLLVPGPGGMWITTSQDAQVKADAAQTAAVGYTNDTINAQDLPGMRAQIASAGSRLSGAEGSILTLGAQMANAGSRLSGAEGSIGTLSAQMGDAGSRLSGAEANIGSLVGQLASAASRLSAVETGKASNASLAGVASDLAGLASDMASALSALGNRQNAFRDALNALRNYVNTQHPGAPSWPGGL